MSSQTGQHRLGPARATLAIRTGRDGAAARAGHDLLLEVGSWEATLVLEKDPADAGVELSADPAPRA